MKWIKCTDRMPPAGKHVKMKWSDGKTEWTGNIIHELANTNQNFYHKLLWADESKLTDTEVLVEALESLIKDIKSKPNDTRYATALKKADEAIATYKESIKQ